MAKNLCAGNLNSGPLDVPYRRLAAAIIKQAAIDARAKNGRLASESKKWLKNAGLDWLETLGFRVDRKFWNNWINLGCPGDLNAKHFEKPEPLEEYS